MEPMQPYTTDTSVEAEASQLEAFRSSGPFAGDMLGFATVILLAVVFAGSSCHAFEDVISYILSPGVLGGLIGASSGLAAFLTVSGRGVHPILAALPGAILVPVLSAIVMNSGYEGPNLICFKIVNEQNCLKRYLVLP